MANKSPSEQIDDIIRLHTDWHGELLARLRTVIQQSSPGLVEEVKWKKPSRPEGVPVWSKNGIVCIGEILKQAVRLTFPKGAALKDPHQLFNRRLTSASVRAIDFGEGEAVNEAALAALIREAVELHSAKSNG